VIEKLANAFQINIINSLSDSNEKNINILLGKIQLFIIEAYDITGKK